MQTEIEVALRSPDLTKKEAIDLLKSNLEEVGKLKSLSEGLLTLATTSSRDTRRQQVSIKDVASLALEQAAKPAVARKITIKSIVKEAHVLGNPQQLLNLLSILLDNAIKYSQPGSKITIETKPQDKYAVISVTDRGQGIAAADLPHIYDRFYRADTSRSSKNAQGYGLGLAIAKNIVDLHKGAIEVKSKPGRGSTFTVRLPLA